MSDVRITQSIVSAIIKLDPHKECGLDDIPAIVIEKCALELANVLSKLYNKCLTASCFPAYWKSSTVVPVFKNSGKLSDPSISLLPLFGKVLEALINSELVKHLTSWGLLSDKQYGFHFSWSTTDMLMVIAKNTCQMNGEIRPVVLDISKAFI